MLEMTRHTLCNHRIATSLDKLDQLLVAQDELNETGPGGLQEFFLQHPDLLLLMGLVFCEGLSPAAYLGEFSIFHEFRADFAVCNADRSKFLFIEFEDAKRDSIFSRKSRGSSHISYQWSRKFEHGFSQIVDWHFRLDDYERTSKIEEHFGRQHIEYEGVLVSGRDKFIEATGMRQRLRWRRRHTVINSRNLRCFTYDEVASYLREALRTPILIPLG